MRRRVSMFAALAVAAFAMGGGEARARENPTLDKFPIVSAPQVRGCTDALVSVAKTVANPQSIIRATYQDVACSVQKDDIHTSFVFEKTGVPPVKYSISDQGGRIQVTVGTPRINSDGLGSVMHGGFIAQSFDGVNWFNVNNVYLAPEIEKLGQTTSGANPTLDPREAFLATLKMFSDYGKIDFSSFPPNVLSIPTNDVYGAAAPAQPNTAQRPITQDQCNGGFTTDSSGQFRICNPKPPMP